MLSSNKPMNYYELNKDMHNSCVQTMKELVQYGLASQEDLKNTLSSEIARTI